MISGPAISAWLKASGVGVRIAAATNAPRIAYLRFLASIFGGDHAHAGQEREGQRQLEDGAEGQRELQQEVDVVLRS